MTAPKQPRTCPTAPGPQALKNAIRRQPRRPADPIVAAVEPRTARAVGHTAARLARELGAPLVFVTVRPSPPAILGVPYYQRRLTRELFRHRKALDTALAVASGYNVMSSGEILEGDTAARIVEFARARQARLIVIGQRRRRLRPSVSRRVIRASEHPVVVATTTRDCDRTVRPRRRPFGVRGVYVRRNFVANARLRRCEPSRT